MRINNDIFGQVRVIASTLVGAGNKLLDGKRFGTLFIDEAAQALEAACWIPIRRASRVIFAGDHCQLPPTVKSLEALKGGLGKTLMERIVENKPECVSLLQVQYRMNDEIMQFSSDYFYHGQMKSAPEVAHRLVHEGDAPSCGSTHRPSSWARMSRTISRKGLWERPSAASTRARPTSP